MSTLQTCSARWSPVWSWGSADSRLYWSSAAPGTAGRYSERRSRRLIKTLTLLTGVVLGLRLRLVPDRSGWGFGAVISSLVWCPGTPESSFSPLLPALPSHPTDPESATTLLLVRPRHTYTTSLFLSVFCRSQFSPPPPSLPSSPQTAVGGSAPPAPSGRGRPGRFGTQLSGQIWPSVGSKETGQKQSRFKCGEQWKDKYWRNRSSCYPAVIVEQTSGDDAVQEDIVGGDDVVEVLSLMDFVPQLVPRALQHLNRLWEACWH